MDADVSASGRTMLLICMSVPLLVLVAGSLGGRALSCSNTFIRLISSGTFTEPLAKDVERMRSWFDKGSTLCVPRATILQNQLVDDGVDDIVAPRLPDAAEVEKQGSCPIRVALKTGWVIGWDFELVQCSLKGESHDSPLPKGLLQS